MSERKKKVEAALDKLFSTSKSKTAAPQSSSTEVATEASSPATETQPVPPVSKRKPSPSNPPSSPAPEAATPQSLASEVQAAEEARIEEVGSAKGEAKPAQPISASTPPGGNQPIPISPASSEASFSKSAPSTPVPSEVKKTAGDGRSTGDESEFSFTREAASEEICQLVIFTLAGESFGLPIDRVESIIKPQAITVVPHARPYVVGVTNLRGTVLPVIDLRRRFRLTTAEQSEDQRIVVVLFNEEKIGLMVDSVTQVLRLPRAAIEPPPPLVTAFVQSAFVTGIAKVDERLVILLELEKVLLPEHGN